MLRLAQKAFYPGRIPFPLLHVDTTFKFREMIEFRDQQAARVGAQAHRTHQPRRPFGTAPTRSGWARRSAARCSRRGRCSMPCRRRSFDAAFGGARRDEEKSRAKERVYSFRDALGQWDPKNQRPGAVEPLQRPRGQGREHPRVSALQLDRARRLAVHPPGEHSRRSALLRQGARDGGARRRSCSAGARSAAAARREAASPCCAGCVRSAAPIAPAPSARARTRCRRSSRSSSLFRRSERENRVIDHDQEGSMELKKREGYF